MITYVAFRNIISLNMLFLLIKCRRSWRWEVKCEMNKISRQTTINTSFINYIIYFRNFRYISFLGIQNYRIFTETNVDKLAFLKNSFLILTFLSLCEYQNINSQKWNTEKPVDRLWLLVSFFDSKNLAVIVPTYLIK